MRKRWKVGLVVLAVTAAASAVVLFQSGPASAASCPQNPTWFSPSTYVVDMIRGNNVNIRTGPQVGCSSRGRLHSWDDGYAFCSTAGQSVNGNDRWIFVSGRLGVGWVHSSYVRYNPVYTC